MTLFSCSQERLFDSVSITLVGKYTDLKDSYMSVIKALEHSAFRCHRKLILHVCPPLCIKYCVITTLLCQWVESSDLEPEQQDADPKKYHDAWRTVVGAK
jgi:CTP synthase